jgi:hypothetical protein
MDWIYFGNDCQDGDDIDEDAIDLGTLSLSWQDGAVSVNSIDLPPIDIHAVNTDKLTINERLIPDEFDTDGGDLIPEGTDRHPTTILQHTYVTEQPIAVHTSQPSDDTPCDVNMNLTKFPTTMSQDAPDDYSQSHHLGWIL